jgi:Transglycosylase SLT domain
MIAKLLYLPVLAAAGLFAPFSGAFPSPIPAGHTPTPLISTIHRTVVASSTRSEFEKEHAMSPAQLMDRWAPLIKEASRRFEVSEAWIRAVMHMESGGRTLLDDMRPITSDAGAMGIMQIMPDTYQEMRHQYGLGANPYDPHDNVLAGTAYLRWLYGKYGYPKMFAAYNAGPGTLEAQFAGARQLPDETRAYVSGIVHILGTVSNPFQSTPSQPTKVLATLTRPDGSAISIDGAAVDSIRPSLPDEYAPGVQTVVAMGNLHQGVREDLATVASVIRSHGGNV